MIHFESVSLRVWLALSTTPELWGLYAICNFHLTFRALYTCWIKLVTKAGLLSDPILVGNPNLGLFLFFLFSFLFFLRQFLNFLFLAALGLCRCVHTFSSCSEWVLHSSCGAWASHHVGFFFFFYIFFFFVVDFVIHWNETAMGLHAFPIPIPPSYLPLHPLPLGFPSAPGPSTCLMHPTWAGDLFHPR